MDIFRKRDFCKEEGLSGKIFSGENIFGKNFLSAGIKLSDKIFACKNASNFNKGAAG